MSCIIITPALLSAVLYTYILVNQITCMPLPIIGSVAMFKPPCPLLLPRYFQRPLLQCIKTAHRGSCILPTFDCSVQLWPVASQCEGLRVLSPSPSLEWGMHSPPSLGIGGYSHLPFNGAKLSFSKTEVHCPPPHHQVEHEQSYMYAMKTHVNVIIP